MTDRDLVFFSYSHEDKRWLAPVRGALEPYLLDQKLSVWSDQEIETGNRWEIIDASVQSSLAVAGEVYPPVADAKLARAWAGLEAFTPDDLPVLGPVPGLDGVLVAAGFSGHGFALAPAVGEVLARLALGRDAREDLWRGLRPARFTKGAA